MLFQCSSFLLSIVLSLNLAVSLSFHSGVASDALLRLSPSLSLISSRGNSRLAFTHLSYKSMPYHDGAESTPPSAAAATTDVQNEHVHVPPVASSDTSIELPSQQTEPKKKRSRIVKTSINDSRVRVVTTLEQFYECFEGACDSNQWSSKEQEEKIIIVRFFSHWCKSCQAIAPKYNRLARLYPNNIFIDIPVTKDNVDLQKALNIQAVPFGHIYYPKLHRHRDEEESYNSADGDLKCRGYDKFHLVEELKMGKMYWSDFDDIFQTYMKGQCSVAGMDYGDPIACKGSTIREYMVPSESKINL